jgi:hypothetical protein
MTYTQTVIDNFNDNSFNTSIWATPSGATGIAETSAALRISALAAYPEVRSTQNQNLSTGIVAAKVSSSGTSTASTEMYFGASDSAGNIIMARAEPTGGTWTFVVAGAVTIGTPTILVTNLWTGWTQGHWLGIGRVAADNICHLYKSADGVTWTEMGYVTLGGTFGKTAVGLDLTVGVYSSTSTWIGVFDDASYFAYTSDVAGKVRSGGAWVSPTAIKVRSGGAWVSPTAIKVRSGGAWVSPT